MNLQLNNLYDKIYKDDSNRDPRTFITTIENEINLIEYPDYEDHEDFYKATRLISDYGIMLFRTGYKKKSHQFIILAIRQIENDKYLKDKDLLVEPLYEALVFHRGMILYELKEFKDAKYYFKMLVNKFPDNDLYNKWLKACTIGKYGIIEKVFLIAILISIVVSILTKSEDGIIDKISLLGIFIGLFGGLFTRYLGKRSLKQDNYTA